VPQSKSASSFARIDIQGLSFVKFDNFGVTQTGMVLMKSTFVYLPVTAISISATMLACMQIQHHPGK